MTYAYIFILPFAFWLTTNARKACCENYTLSLFDRCLSQECFARFELGNVCKHFPSINFANCCWENVINEYLMPARVGGQGEKMGHSLHSRLVTEVPNQKCPMKPWHLGFYACSKQHFQRRDRLCKADSSGVLAWNRSLAESLPTCFSKAWLS